MKIIHAVYLSKTYNQYEKNAEKLKKPMKEKEKKYD